jgi:exonuclease SbcC
MGDVPRQDEAAINQRYRLALNGLEQRLQAREAEKSQAQRSALLARFDLCQRLEHQVLNATVSEAELETMQQQWQHLSPLNSQLDKPMQVRWQNALQAAKRVTEQANTTYAQQLRDNLHRFDQQLLQLEIVAGLPSPAELSQQRLAMQVAVLQNSLKNGKAGQSKQEQALLLLSLPVCLDSARSQRLLAVLEA